MVGVSQFLACNQNAGQTCSLLVRLAVSKSLAKPGEWSADHRFREILQGSSRRHRSDDPRDRPLRARLSRPRLARLAGRRHRRPRPLLAVRARQSWSAKSGTRQIRRQLSNDGRVPRLCEVLLCLESDATSSKKPSLMIPEIERKPDFFVILCPGHPSKKTSVSLIWAMFTPFRRLRSLNKASVTCLGIRVSSTSGKEALYRFTLTSDC